MPPATADSFLKALQQSQLFDSQRLTEVTGQLQAKFAEPLALAKELVRRGWLTSFQAKQLLMGRSRDLVLGPYVLLDALGEGGMGQVFKARHQIMDRVVALKVIRQDRLANEDAVRRFHREIQAAAKLSHANIVIAHDAAQVGTTHLLVMEYVEGTDLAKIVSQRGPLPVAQACDYIRQAALGLQHAHERGLVHRDIKPANLLVAEKGDVVKILDMGLARLDRTGAHATTMGELTQEGVVMGTPDYLAPEQALDAHAADIRADIYSLGCTLYYLLTGQVPFAGGTLAQKLLWHQQAEPPEISGLRADLPAPLLPILKKMLAKRPQDRYQKPAEVAAALGPLAQREGDTVSVAATRREDSSSSESEPTLAAAKTLPTGKKSSTMFPLALSQRKWAVLGGLGALVAVTLGTILVGVSVWFFFIRSPSSRSSKKDEPVAEQPGRLKNSLDMELVQIPDGSFSMGSPAGEQERLEDEGPVHRVHITRPFYMGVHEVTQRQFEALMGTNPSRFNSAAGGGPDYPVEQVSWEEAMEFCRRLSDRPEEKKAGRVYRLPTEAEWEYACRAGTKAPFSFGTALTSEQANFDGNRPYGTEDKGPYIDHTCKVGAYKPNAWGLYDMHGNVSEWCLDYYKKDYYEQSPARDPQCKEVTDGRVLRGGSWISEGRSCRSAYRSWHGGHMRSTYVGFRVVCEVERP